MQFVLLSVMIILAACDTVGSTSVPSRQDSHLNRMEYIKPYHHIYEYGRERDRNEGKMP